MKEHILISIKEHILMSSKKHILMSTKEHVLMNTKEHALMSTTEHADCCTGCLYVLGYITCIMCFYRSDCFTDYFYIVNDFTYVFFTGLTVLQIVSMLLVTNSSLQTGKDRGEIICYC